MRTQKFTTESKEVRKRAAEIRKKWSPLEKLRRTGLPPDVPARLRDFILGSSQPNWTAAAFAQATSSNAPLQTR